MIFALSFLTHKRTPIVIVSQFVSLNFFRLRQLEIAAKATITIDDAINFLRRGDLTVLNDEISDQLAGQVRTCQIVVAAMVAGCLFFLGIAGWKYMQQQAAAEPVLDNNSLILVACAIPLIIARFVVPNIMTNAARRRLSDNHNLTRDELAVGLINVFHIRTVVAAALLEGAAFIAITVFLLFGSMIGVIAAAAIVFALSAVAPTYDRAETWLEEQVRMAEEERGSSLR